MDGGSAANGSTSGGLGASTYDSVSVTLPSGLSIGMAHFGSGDDDAATDAQMLASVEAMAEKFAAWTPPATSGGSTATSGASGSAASGSGASQASNQDTDATSGQIQRYTSFDMIEIDTPNGYSVEVEHATSTTESADQSQTVANQMAQAAEQLVADLEGFSGTSAGADASAAAGSTGATGATSSDTTSTGSNSSSSNAAMMNYLSQQMAAYAANMALTGSAASGTQATA